ncbi:hypothetical protein SBF1_7630002 [Candidatus Desulfosporosinus infrequens]|uniref:Uncharacterized protein n=1 Tax=Candidatus Desulfosporosinus infrequens TaxID=2043169 RepID=A0A2U3LRF7_9FIRM|nr:hypothetical protein SBF1_7630002 [Candidatus Desulfosporosinus infrequens]
MYSGQIVLDGLTFSIVNRHEDTTFFLVHTVDNFVLSVYIVHIQIVSTLLFLFTAITRLIQF